MNIFDYVFYPSTTSVANKFCKLALSGKIEEAKTLKSMFLYESNDLVCNLVFSDAVHNYCVSHFKYPESKEKENMLSRIW